MFADITRKYFLTGFKIYFMDLSFEHSEHYTIFGIRYNEECHLVDHVINNHLSAALT